MNGSGLESWQHLVLWLNILCYTLLLRNAYEASSCLPSSNLIDCFQS